MLNGIFEVPEDYIENGDGTGTPVYSAKNRVRVQFEKVYTLNEAKTLELGKEVFDEDTVILMQAKGDSNIVAHRATEQHKAIYPQQWRKYQQGQNGEIGQSIASLYGMNPNLMAAFAARGIFSIQQLADADDALISDMPGWEKIKSLAKVWISSRKGEEQTASLIVEATAYKARAEGAEAELAKLRAELAAAKAKPKRTRVRKKVTQNEN